MFTQAINDAAERLAKDIDNEILWSLQMSAKKEWQHVMIPFEKPSDKEFLWNEACAWAMEEFGLPGERYVIHMGGNAIDFLFKDKADAILMTLRWV